MSEVHDEANNAEPDRSDDLQLCSIVSAREVGAALTDVAVGVKADQVEPSTDPR